MTQPRRSSRRLFRHLAIWTTVVALWQAIGMVAVLPVGARPGERPPAAINPADPGAQAGWGRNDFGQIGDGTTNDRLLPVEGIAPHDAVALSAGGQHSLVLRSDGLVRSFGRNSLGQLGTGVFLTLPGTQIGADIGNNHQIATGHCYALARRNDGAVFAWGQNNLRQLGDNTTTNRPSPVRVRFADGTNLTNITAVAAGGNNASFALRNDGRVLAWGNSTLGSLGTGACCS